MAAPIESIASRFELPGRCVEVEALGRGHIHETYAVRCEAPPGTPRAVLQRINTAVFPDPAGLMNNLLRITAHLRRRLEASGLDPERRCLHLIPTRDGELLHRDAEGRPWRCFRFVEGASAVDAVDSRAQAAEAARAFGAFVAQLSDLPPPPLAVTIEGFHDRPRRIDQLAVAVETDRRDRADAVSTEVERCVRWFETVEGRLADCGVDEIPRRIVHHDCKVNNVLFDDATGEALCVIDLDTVMEGNVLSDFGELVRTTVSRAPEDELNLASMSLDLDLFAGLARGFLTGTGGLLTDAEIRTLPLAGLALALMNAIRFLTDYVEGDIYFRTLRPGHNLDRCRAQLRLVELLYEHRDEATRRLEREAARVGA